MAQSNAVSSPLTYNDKIAAQAALKAQKLAAKMAAEKAKKEAEAIKKLQKQAAEKAKKEAEAIAKAQKLLAQAAKKSQEQAKKDAKSGKIPAPMVNDPQKAIKAENFEDKLKTFKTNENGFYVNNDSDEYSEENYVDYAYDFYSDSKDDHDGEKYLEDMKHAEEKRLEAIKERGMNGLKYNDTMGFDLFGITVDTAALQQKAITAAQTAVTNYIAPPTAVSAGVAPAQSGSAIPPQTVFSSQPLDPQIKTALIIGGGLVGTLLCVTLIKTMFK